MAKIGFAEGLLNSEQLPFQGVDIWNGYEFSWLNAKGKPEIAVIEIHFPMDTINLIESKSLKLYLNSFYNTRFENHESVITQVQRDLRVRVVKQLMYFYVILIN